MIRFEKVTRYFPALRSRRYILRDCDFVFPRKTSIGVLGRNGAGKTTMLRLIGGAIKPNSGRIVRDATVSWPLGLGSGWQGSLTGEQNSRFVCRIHGLDPDTTEDVCEHVRRFSELGDYYYMPVKTYSAGMKGRLTFGMSLSFEFDYYLVDELTAVGDPIFRAKADEAFASLRDRASLVLVSHNFDTLRKNCEAGVVLNNGTAQYYADLEEAIAYYKAEILHQN